MNRSLYGLIGCLILAAALTALLPALASTAPEPDPNRLADYLPPDTYAYIDIPSVPAALEGLAQHPFARLLENKEVTGFAGFYLGLARGFVNRFARQWAGADLDEIRKIFAGRIELAVPGHDLSGRWSGLSAALAVDVTGSEEKAREVVGRLVDHLLGAGHTVEVTELGGAKVMVYRGEPEVFAFFARGRFFAAAGRPLALRLVEGKPIEGPRLADDAGFKRVTNRTRAAGSHAFIYLSWVDLLKQSIEHSRQTQDEEQFARGMAITDATGLRNFRRFGVSVRFDERGALEIEHMDIAGKPTGLARLTDAIGTGLELPARMGAGTLFYHGGRLDLARTWRAIREFIHVLAENSDVSGVKEIHRQLAALEDGRLGFKLSDDLLAALGNEYGVAVGLSPSGGVIPDAVAVVKVKDAERLRATLARLCEKLSKTEIRVTTGRLGDTEFRVFRGVRPGLTPSVAVMDDTLAIGLTIQSLKRFLRPSGERLPAAKAFGQALGDVGLQNLETVAFLTYLDLPKSLIYGYNLGIPLLSMLDLEDLPFDLDIDIGALPAAETLAAGFSPFISVKRIGADGVTTETISPLPLNVFWLASLLAGISGSDQLVMPALPGPRPKRQ